ncbi:MAG: hypothetical protein AAGI25_00335 [Bacteroidota bacterium]
MITILIIIGFSSCDEDSLNIDEPNTEINNLNPGDKLKQEFAKALSRALNDDLSLRELIKLKH